MKIRAKEIAEGTGGLTANRWYEALGINDELDICVIIDDNGYISYVKMHNSRCANGGDWEVKE